MLQAFSGAPTEYREINADKSKQEKLWSDMLACYQNGAIMCSGTKSEGTVEKAGLVLGHAYTIVALG